MPRTVVQGQSFKYFREQAAKAIPVGGTTPSQGVPVPPSGFVFITDFDGAYLSDWDGAYLLEAA